MERHKRKLSIGHANCKSLSWQGSIFNLLQLLSRFDPMHIGGLRFVSTSLGEDLLDGY